MVIPDLLDPGGEPRRGEELAAGVSIPSATDCAFTRLINENPSVLDHIASNSHDRMASSPCPSPFCFALFSTYAVMLHYSSFKDFY
jgi:hypothetical protein